MAGVQVLQILQILQVRGSELMEFAEVENVFLISGTDPQPGPERVCLMFLKRKVQVQCKNGCSDITVPLITLSSPFNQSLGRDRSLLVIQLLNRFSEPSQQGGRRGLRRLLITDIMHHRPQPDLNLDYCFQSAELKPSAYGCSSS